MKGQVQSRWGLDIHRFRTLTHDWIDLAGLAKAAAASAVCPSLLPKVILGLLNGMGTTLVPYGPNASHGGGEVQRQVQSCLSHLVLPACGKEHHGGWPCSATHINICTNVNRSLHVSEKKTVFKKHIISHSRLIRFLWSFLKVMTLGDHRFWYTAHNTQSAFRK